MSAEREPQGAPATPEKIVLYMLHCGLKGEILQEVCRREGLNVQIRQFPREQSFAYHMHRQRPTPDLVLIRGHFIGLFHDMDQGRRIPHVVVSSKDKYGKDQPVFIHAEKGYEPQAALPIYREIAQAIKQMLLKGKEPKPGANPDPNPGRE